MNQLYVTFGRHDKNVYLLFGTCWLQVEREKETNGEKTTNVLK